VLARVSAHVNYEMVVRLSSSRTPTPTQQPSYTYCKTPRGLPNAPLALAFCGYVVAEVLARAGQVQGFRAVWVLLWVARGRPWGWRGRREMRGGWGGEYELR
jgi:hypothetical protein